MSDTDEALLARFVRTRAEGDFRRLYDRVTPVMLGLAMRLGGGDRAVAEDVVQESWARAVERLDRYRAGGSVVRWLNGFVVRCWSETRRVGWREVVVEDDALEALASPDEGRWNDLSFLLEAVYALPDGFRAVLVLHDVEGYTHAEIAERLGIDEGTSKSQLSRARRRMRETLGLTRDS